MEWEDGFDSVFNEFLDADEGLIIVIEKGSIITIMQDRHLHGRAKISSDGNMII
jgi:hypothetical protein